MIVDGGSWMAYVRLMDSQRAMLQSYIVQVYTMSFDQLSIDEKVFNQRLKKES